MKTLAGSFGGIEKIKTAQTRGIRSAPANSEARTYLDLYMLLKKKERLERRDDQGQLEGVLKRISELQESLPPQLEEVKPARAKQTANKTPRKDWKVMSIDY